MEQIEKTMQQLRNKNGQLEKSAEELENELLKTKEMNKKLLTRSGNVILILIEQI
jgi:hypothetical protein